MDARILDPSQWAETSGAVIFYGIMAVIVLGSMLKLIEARWDDWIDERWGRGSVRDWWLLRDIERDSKP